MSLASRQLDVLANPFSQATNNPKIPDGKISASMGIRLTGVGEFTMKSPTGYIAVFPGLNNTVCYWEAPKAGNPTAVPPVPPTNAVLQFIKPANDHVKLQGKTDHLLAAASTGILNIDPKYTKDIIGLAYSPENIPIVQQNPELTVSQWRVVSSGLKLTLVNSTENDDGWFEAIRIKPTVDFENFRFADFTSPFVLPETNTNANIEANLGPFHFAENPAAGVPPTNKPDKQLANRNNYMTGKMSDIDRYIWYLQPADDAHEFCKLQSRYTPDTYQNQIEDFVDPNVDCILIKLHGTPDSSGNCASRLMAHVQHNIEIVYDDTSILSRLMTKSEKATKALERVRANITKNGSPAMLNKITAGLPAALRGATASTRKRKTKRSRNY